MSDLKAEALRLFDAAIQRADPARALENQLHKTPLPPLHEGGRLFLLAIGKASVPMMKKALEVFQIPTEH